MKRKMTEIKRGRAYQSPTASVLEVLAEGTLCGSFYNEAYEDSVNYGSDEKEDKGWY